VESQCHTKLSYRGAQFEELARRPQVALVDELAHTNIPGTGYEKAVAGRGGAAGSGRLVGCLAGRMNGGGGNPSSKERTE
jgi:osmosensitive K+ channel His kinase sensor protein